MKPLILYHANCMDGFGAAFAAWLHFRADADYLPVQYSDALPDNVDGRTVYLLDFCYPETQLLELQSRSASLIVIDHHKSNEALLNALPLRTLTDDDVLFDTKYSGAMLSWKYFHREPPPLLISYIQDRDLWEWLLKKSREVSAALAIQDRTFEQFEAVLYAGRTGVEILAEQGDLLLRAERAYVDSRINQDIQFENIGGYVVPCINNTHLISETGNRLALIDPSLFSAQWYETPTKRVYSLRSVEGGMDVSEIAKQYGGGGHKHAAGFSIPRAEVKL